ncbi:hypothetical protein T10_9093 [Trichinella papuae]|uniref:Uncharacterized protein n=1 Tax=Trichinella papuae TaxID=268474 RepID=A0A0V1MEV5_9BILA|nr:hypothetical protein T10_9093 [Trichinella papuae]
MRINQNLYRSHFLAELLREFSSTLAKGFARILEIHTDSGTHRFLKTSIPFCILGADLPSNFPRDVSIINHGCHLQKRLLAVLRVLCIWCVPACRRLFALAELKLGKGDRPLIIRRHNRPGYFCFFSILYANCRYT